MTVSMFEQHWERRPCVRCGHVRRVCVHVTHEPQGDRVYAATFCCACHAEMRAEYYQKLSERFTQMARTIRDQYAAAHRKRAAKGEDDAR